MSNDEDEFQDYVGTDDINEQNHQLNQNQVQQIQTVPNKIQNIESDQVQKIQNDPVTGQQSIQNQQINKPTYVHEDYIPVTLNQDRMKETKEMQVDQKYLQFQTKNDSTNQVTPVEENLQKEKQLTIQQRPEVLEELHDNLPNQYLKHQQENEQKHESSQKQIEHNTQEQIKTQYQYQNEKEENKENKREEQNEQEDDEFGEFASQTSQKNQNEELNISDKFQQQISIPAVAHVILSHNIGDNHEDEQFQTDNNHLQPANFQQKSKSTNQPQTIVKIQPSTKSQVSIPVHEPVTLEDQLTAFLDSLPNYKSIIEKSFIDVDPND